MKAAITLHNVMVRIGGQPAFDEVLASVPEAGSLTLKMRGRLL